MRGHGLPVFWRELLAPVHDGPSYRHGPAFPFSCVWHRNPSRALASIRLRPNCSVRDASHLLVGQAPQTHTLGERRELAMEGCGLRDEPCFEHPRPVREVGREEIRRCKDLHIAPIGCPARDPGKTFERTSAWSYSPIFRPVKGLTLLMRFYLTNSGCCGAVRLA